MENEFHQAIQYLQAGRNIEARQLLITVVKNNPNYAQAWFVLSYLVEQKEYQIDCLHRTLKLIPDHVDAKKRLQKLTASNPLLTNTSEIADKSQTNNSFQIKTDLQHGTPLIGEDAKPSLEDLIRHWFGVLNFRDQTVLQYLYLDVKPFSVDAVGRIIGENTQKANEIRQKALDKLCTPDAYVLGLPIIDWYLSHLQNEDNGDDSSYLINLLKQDWEVGNISPFGLFCFIADVLAKKNKNSEFPKTKNTKEDVDSLIETNNKVKRAKTDSPPLKNATVAIKSNRFQSIPPKKRVEYNIPQEGSTPLLALGLSKRVYNALKRAGIETIEELALLPEKKLWRIKNIGETSVTELHSLLNNYQHSKTTPITSPITESEQEQKAEYLQPDLPIALGKKSVGELRISTKSYNTLINHNIKTIKQLTSLSTEQLLGLKRIGTKAIEEIQAALTLFFSESELQTKIYNDQNDIKLSQKIEKNQLKLPFETDSISIAELGLSVRSYNILQRNNIKTIQELAELSDEDLLDLRSAGIKTVNEIRTSFVNFLASNENELETPKDLSLSEVNRPLQDQFGANTLSENDANGPENINLSSKVKAGLQSLPLDKISINRLGLDKIANKQLQQQKVYTLGDLLRFDGFITKKEVVGNTLSQYLEWLIEQNQSVWETEVQGNGIYPLVKTALSNTTCEILVTEWLESLSDYKERQILLKRYGIHDGPLTLNEIGNELGVSRERIRQIEKRGLYRLKILHQHHGYTLLGPILNYLKFTFNEYGGILSELEAKSLFIESNLVRVGNINLVGFLMLICEIDDQFQFFKKQKVFTLTQYSIGLITRIQEKFGKIAKAKLTPTSQQVLLEELKNTDLYDKIQHDVSESFLLACLRLHPTIEQLESGLYANSSTSSKRLGAIVRALREIGEPAHYSVITEKTNSSLATNDQFTERAIHAKLGQHPEIFVWVRLRGTYGLKEWGLEQGLSYVDAIEKIFLMEGKPLTFEQIINKIPEYREHFDEGSVIITLSTHERFKNLSNNTYGLSSWNSQLPGFDFGDRFGEQLAQRQAEFDSRDSNSNDEIDTRDEVDKIRRIGLDFFAP